MNSPTISAAPSSPARSRPERLADLRLPGWLAPALTLALILLVWELSCRLLALPSFLLPAPAPSSPPARASASTSGWATSAPRCGSRSWATRPRS